MTTNGNWRRTARPDLYKWHETIGVTSFWMVRVEETDDWRVFAEQVTGKTYLIGHFKYGAGAGDAVRRYIRTVMGFGREVSHGDE